MYSTHYRIIEWVNSKAKYTNSNAALKITIGQCTKLVASISMVLYWKIGNYLQILFYQTEKFYVCLGHTVCHNILFWNLWQAVSFFKWYFAWELNISSQTLGPEPNGLIWLLERMKCLIWLREPIKGFNRVTKTY